MSELPSILPFRAPPNKREASSTAVPYVEFAVVSNFSFLHGASHPEELMGQASQLGLSGLGLADRNSVAGVVRAHLARRENNFSLRYHPGARLVFADGTPDILAYPRDRAGWARLCRLLTQGNLRAEKGSCVLRLVDLLEHAAGLELIVMEQCTVSTPSVVGQLCEAAPGRVRLAAAMLYRGNDRERLAQRAEAARQAGIPLIAVNDVLYHHFERRQLQDVLTCIREHVTIDAAGRRLAANAERYLKPPQAMARLFRDFPEAIAETQALSDALTFSLDELRYEYPDETRAGFASAQEALVAFTLAGAAERYPGGIPPRVVKNLEHEFTLIEKLDYAPYFLTVHEIVRFARRQGILCQGRGSAANSTVCYCLRITDVDPQTHDLLFERFISEDRHEPPDIDVDFEHERREEVIQYIYSHYGRARAGIAATVISYRGRSAIREVGKAFGLSEDMIGALASSIWGMGGGAVGEDALRRAGLDPESPRVAKIIALTKEIIGFPRHLSQHVGGFVITRDRLDEAVPIANGAMPDRTFIEWDKDDIEALGMLKVDVLGLGMLTCIRKAFALIEKHYPDWAERDGLQRGRPTLAGIRKEDPAVYRMLQRADSVGVFQVESRAQMSMLPRLKPEKFYDLVIEVAIVRPGPIQGDMVHPYLRRRQGIEKVEFPSKELEEVLHRTLGVPLFQEQAMRIAIVAGGFTPGEADKLRRAMATFKRTGTIGTFRTKMIEGMLARNYTREFAERCFNQIEGFGEYGFPESHAASFALLVYASAWIKCRYPDVFAAALLNAQPMGFYAPAQIVRDVREHGVEVRGVDINFSDYDATLEPGREAREGVHSLHADIREDMRAQHALRLGLRAVRGLKEADAHRVVACRGAGYRSVHDLWQRTKLGPPTLERLADADAFGSLGLTRRQALWAVKALGRSGDQDDLPLFARWSSSTSHTSGPPMSGPSMRQPCASGGDDRLPACPGTTSEGNSGHSEPPVELPAMPLGEEVVNDYRFISLSLRQHPAAFLRGDLAKRRIVPNETLRSLKSGARTGVSGLVTIRQRPGSAQGVIFMTIEDETGNANIIIWPAVFERYRPVVLGARYVAVRGPMQEQSGVIHVVAEQIEDLTPLLGRLLEDAPPIEALARADAVKHPQSENREKPTRAERHAAFRRTLSEVPNIGADLDVSARGSAHAPTRRAP